MSHLLGSKRAKAIRRCITIWVIRESDLWKIYIHEIRRRAWYDSRGMDAPSILRSISLFSWINIRTSSICQRIVDIDARMDPCVTLRSHNRLWSIESEGEGVRGRKEKMEAKAYSRQSFNYSILDLVALVPERRNNATAASRHGAMRRKTRVGTKRRRLDAATHRT